MRPVSALLTVLLVAACGGADEQPAVTEDAFPAEEAATAPAASVANFAGTWDNVVRLDGVDDPIPSTMTGSASGSDWTMSLEGRDAIPLQVRIVGDSLIGESAEYESILRPGVMVTVRTASVLHGDMLMGNVLTTYRTAAGDEQVRGTLQGTRVQ